MGITSSAPDLDYGAVQDSEPNQQQQMFLEFYDDLKAQFGDDISSVFTAPISDLFDPNQIPNLDQRTSTCQAAIRFEPRLGELRYRLVPGRISETHFWTQFLIKFDEFSAHYNADFSPAHQQTQTVPDRSSVPTDKVSVVSVPVADVPPPKNELSVSSIPALKTEVSLLTIPEVFVYQIPPRLDSKGYYAQSWGLENPLWSGALRVLSSDDYVVFLRLYNPATSDIFANSDLIDLQKICRQSEPNRSARLKAIQLFIEPTLDTSRYFVIRFRNSISGQIAFLGVGFRHRSNAFDLNASIFDQLSKCERFLNLDESKDKSDRHRNTNRGNIDNDGIKKFEEQATKSNRSQELLSSPFTLPSLPSLDKDQIPPALSPPKSQYLYRETDDEDDDSFGSFLSSSQQH